VDDGDSEDEYKEETKSTEGYNPLAIGMGTAANAKRQYGATLNDFAEGYEERFLDADKVIYLYVFDSSQITVEGSIVAPVHTNIVLPVLKEINGLVNAKLYDCAHPFLKALDWETYSGPFFACNFGANQGRAPSMTLYRQPELKKNPYTGEAMKPEVK